MPAIAVGAVMRGGGIGIVEESRNPRFAPGDLVQGLLGWQRYSLSDGSGLAKVMPLPVPFSAYLGALGHIGLTAYFGLLDIGKPKAGETLVVSAAAGAVGSLVGQIGKIKGCRVVGIAGSEDKCRWMRDDLGFDAVINYRIENVREVPAPPRARRHRHLLRQCRRQDPRNRARSDQLARPGGGLRHDLAIQRMRMRTVPLTSAD